jgi:hypothetical protein
MNDETTMSAGILTDGTAAKLSIWDKLFAGSNPIRSGERRDDSGEGTVSMILDEEVEADLAQGCIDAFEALMKDGASFNTMKHAYTKSVSFGTAALGQWLMKHEQQSDFNKLKICLGIYTEAMVKAHKLPADYQGRLTVFLWPHKDEMIAKITDPITTIMMDAPPFNLGDLKP